MIIFIFMFCLLTSIAPAAVVFRAPTLSQAEFEAGISGATEQIRFSNWQLEQLQSSPENLNVVRAFEKAEYSYLQGELALAERQYRQISEDRWRFDWSNSARRAIFTAMIRMATLQSSDSLRQGWLKQAAELDPTLVPDVETFPPPILEAYSNAHKSLRWITLQSLAAANPSAIILVNGRRFGSERGALASVPDTRVRVTVLSDHSMPETKVDVAQNLNQRWNQRPLVSGSCENPIWAWPKQDYPETAQAIFSGGCQVSPRAAAAPLALADLRPQTSTEQPALAVPTEKASLPRPTRKPFWKSTWFWVGVGVVASGALIYQASQRSTPPQGDAKEGF